MVSVEQHSQVETTYLNTSLNYLQRVRSANKKETW